MTFGPLFAGENGHICETLHLVFSLFSVSFFFCVPSSEYQHEFNFCSQIEISVSRQCLVCDYEALHLEHLSHSGGCKFGDLLISKQNHGFMPFLESFVYIYGLDYRHLFNPDIIHQQMMKQGAWAISECNIHARL